MTQTCRHQRVILDLTKYFVIDKRLYPHNVRREKNSSNKKDVAETLSSKLCRAHSARRIALPTYAIYFLPVTPFRFLYAAHVYCASIW